MSRIASHAPYKFAPFARRAAPALALVLGSCTYEAHHAYTPPPPPSYDLWEAEPNDAACCPDGIGQLWVGDSLVIGGDITQLGPDFFDGFAFQNMQPCDIEFALVPVYSNADLDLCVYDPMLGDFAFCFETGNAIESGRFSVPSAFTDFQLVVSSYANASEYRLEIHCVPISLGVMAQNSAQHERSGRAVPLASYFGGAVVESEPEAAARVVAQGELLEIDMGTGDVVERAVRVVENRPAERARAASQRLVRREN
jgi:hypothetical protein